MSADLGWFTRDRLGMFIHWGIYALAARHEWVRQLEQMSEADYDRYFRHFDPDLYDPEAWAAEAAAAGMKYFVVTTKHHDGFCLWDSGLTDYKAPATPAGRDLLRPMVEAFRARGLKVGFYHSLIDWHHPDFTVDDLHPLRHGPDRVSLNRGRRWSRYVDYLHGQVAELLTGFGKIDIMWFDFSYPPGLRIEWPPDCAGAIVDGKGRDDWRSEELLSTVRKLQPGIIVNDRLDLEGAGDIVTPEQRQPRGRITVGGKPVAWEACHTFSGSWGYHRDEDSWKSPGQLVRMLVDTVSKDGNLLLNVGPDGRGRFDPRARERLGALGEWMSLHGRSIYGSGQAPPGIGVPPDCRLTWNPESRRLYLHFFAWPFRQACLDGLGRRVEYAQFLHDGSEVGLADREPGGAAGGAHAPLVLELPVRRPAVAVPVVELFLAPGE